MADRYNDDVERGWNDDDRRYVRGESDQDRGRGGGEGRSFSPRREFERDRSAGRSGGDLTGPRYGAGGYTGYGDHPSSERGYGERNASAGYSSGGGADAERYGAQYGGRYGQASGGRYYGDDGRQTIPRDPYGAGRPDPAAHRYDQAFQDRAEGHSEFGFGYDLDGADGRYRREASRSAQVEGGHRGRGPQGYKRSDERINEDAHERLTEDPHVDASAIVVAVQDGEVTLSGTVDSRHAKHHAEHVVERLSGVIHVQNNLRVDSHAHLRPSGPTTSAETPLGENTKLSDQAAGKS